MYKTIAWLFLILPCCPASLESEGQEVYQRYPCDEGYWLLGAEGETVGVLDYPHVMDFINGVAIARFDQREWGVIDTAGEVLLRFEADYCSDFSGAPSSALAMCLSPETGERSYALIQIDGAGAPMCRDIEAGDFVLSDNNGPVAVYRPVEGGAFLVVLPSCERIEHPPCVKLMKISDSDGLYLYRLAEGEPLGVMDREGRVLTPALFRGVGRVSPVGIARASMVDSRLWGYIDVNDGGRWVIEPTWVTAGDFVEGVASVCNSDGECFLIEADGARICRHHYVNVGTFRGGVAKASVIDAVSGQLRTGYINEAGHWVVPPEYLYATDFNGRFGIARSETEILVLGPSGQVLSRRQQSPKEAGPRETGIRP